MTVLFAVAVAWCVLSVPFAVFVGRMLRVGAVDPVDLDAPAPTIGGAS